MQRGTVIPEHSIKNSMLNDVMAPRVTISHKTLSSVIVWQHLAVFFVKSRVFLFCCLGMFIPNLQKSHPLNTDMKTSSFIISALGGTKDKEAQHLTCLHYTSSWWPPTKLESFKKCWEEVGVGATSFRCAVIALFCACAHPTTTPQCLASCVVKTSPYAMWLLCTLI